MNNYKSDVKSVMVVMMDYYVFSIVIESSVSMIVVKLNSPAPRICCFQRK